MFKIIHRQDVGSWSANQSLILADYVERSRYPLSPISHIQSCGKVALEFLCYAMNTPTFLRYRRAKRVPIGDILESALLLCPLPPDEIQQSIVRVCEKLSRDNQRRWTNASLAAENAMKMLSEALGIEKIDREWFGPLCLIKKAKVESWSARRALIGKEYACRTPLSEMGSLLLNKNDTCNLTDDPSKRLISDDDVLCIRPGSLGNGSLFEAPELVRRTFVEKKRGHFVPVGSVVFYRLRPENMRFWINRGEFRIPIFAMSGDFVVCRINDNVVDVDYFDLLMRMPFVYEQFTKKASGHMPRISISSMMSVKCPVPAFHVQRALAFQFLAPIKGPGEVSQQVKNAKKTLIDYIERVLFDEAK